MKSVLKAVGLVLALLLVFATPALADEAPNAVAAQWGPTQHVVVAPGASPTINNPNALNNQIGATGLPIYVAVTNDTPADLGKAFSAKLGKRFQGVIVAAGSHGIYAAAEQTPGGSQAADIASNVAKQYGRNLDAALHAYVAQFTQAAASANHPAGQVSVSNAVTHSLAWLWWMLGIIAALAVAVVVFLASRRRAEATRRRARQLSDIEQELIRAKSKIDDLADWIDTAPVDVSTENRKATVAYADAKQAKKEGRVADAETHLETLDTAYARAKNKVHPPAPHSSSDGVRQARSVPQEDRKQATINARTETGQTVVINNNDYRTRSSGGYVHQWPGGMYGGAYWSPGYYPYSFWGGGYSWSLTDMVIADAIIDDHWSGRYGYDSYGGGGYGYNDGALVNAPQDTNWQGDTGSQGGGDYGTGADNSSSDGGGGYGGGLDDSSITTDPTPSYTPDPTPSYTDDSSSSNDYSGGSDYSSGGSDYSSGGSSDSGGSDW